MSAAFYGAVGLGFLLAPAVFGAWVSLDLSDPVARTDVRAVYGGLCTAFALFLVWCGQHPSRTEPGILAGALGVGCLATGRTLGLVLDGVNVENLFFVSLELLFVVGGAVAWRAHRS
ncbi:MAG: DUF4345 family protein [Myxococcota bacterium]